MIKLGIICGCLPTQAGIEQNDLYHHILRENIFRKSGEEVVVSSAWYTTLSESNSKVSELISKENPDIILYHVRPDPYLRVSKLFIRYKNQANQLKWILNINADDKNISEKIFQERNSLALREASWSKKFFRNINYMLGILFSINNNAIQREKNILKELITICRTRQKKLIIVGPASRPRSDLENYLLNKLELILSLEFKKGNVNYISCYGTIGKNGENLFREDGVHVSKAGHKRMAELIEEKMPAIL